MKLSDFMISLIIIGLVITGFLSFFSYVNVKYPNPQYVESPAMQQYQAQVNETLTLSRETQDQLTNLKPDSSNLDRLNAYFGGAYTAVINAVGSYTMFSNMAQIAFAELGIPGYIIFGLLGIVSILLIFILVRMVTKVE